MCFSLSLPDVCVGGREGREGRLISFSKGWFCARGVCIKDSPNWMF